MMSLLQRSHHVFPVSLPFSSTRSSKLITLYLPAVTSSRNILNRSFRYLLGSYTVEVLPAELRYPKDWLARDKFLIQIYISVKTQDSSLSQLTSPTLAHPNLHLPLLHQDPGHFTWQVHGHQSPMESRLLLMREFVNLCNDVSLLSDVRY